ncbi:MAG: HTH-type transcriptional repressor AseR [Promethearchaeota archaeon]|jgi:ArsR family transcriptional regulator|nr:MAG: HTH-type transcriptional repressor AseR [Candidatus Lokiarchaeota archaeon]
MNTLESCVDMEGVNMVQYFNELRELGKSIQKNKKFREVLDFCNTLGNEERLKIVESLKKQDHCVCELEVILDKSQPTISHHLRELEKIGLIRGWKKGKFTHYDIVDEKMEHYISLLTSRFKEKGKSSN